MNHLEAIWAGSSKGSKPKKPKLCKEPKFSSLVQITTDAAQTYCMKVYSLTYSKKTFSLAQVIVNQLMTHVRLEQLVRNSNQSTITSVLRAWISVADRQHWDSSVENQSCGVLWKLSSLSDDLNRQREMCYYTGASSRDPDSCSDQSCQSTEFLKHKFNGRAEYHLFILIWKLGIVKLDP